MCVCVFRFGIAFAFAFVFVFVIVCPVQNTMFSYSVCSAILTAKTSCETEVCTNAELQTVEAFTHLSNALRDSHNQALNDGWLLVTDMVGSTGFVPAAYVAPVEEKGPSTKVSTPGTGKKAPPPSASSSLIATAAALSGAGGSGQGISASGVSSSSLFFLASATARSTLNAMTP